MSKIKEVINEEFNGELSFDQRDRIESLVLNVLNDFENYDIIAECPHQNINVVFHKLIMEK